MNTRSEKKKDFKRKINDRKCTFFYDNETETTKQTFSAGSQRKSPDIKKNPASGEIPPFRRLFQCLLYFVSQYLQRYTSLSGSVR